MGRFYRNTLNHGICCGLYLYTIECYRRGARELKRRLQILATEALAMQQLSTAAVRGYWQQEKFLNDLIGDEFGREK